MRNTNRKAVNLGSIHMNWLLYNSKPNFQRQGELWDGKRKSLFIDSLLNGFPIPKIYTEDYDGVDKDGYRYGVVDGQQRLTTLIEFFKGKINLNKDFNFTPSSDVILTEEDYPKAGQSYLHFSDPLKEYFKNIAVDIVFLEHWPMQTIRELFRRLNSNTPLTAAEYEYSFFNPVNSVAKEVATHPFFTNKVKFRDNRFSHYSMALKLLKLEYKYVAEQQDISPIHGKAEMLSFIEKEDHVDGAKLGVARVEVLKRLTKLESMFTDQDILLKSKSSVIIYYLLLRKLDKEYAAPLLSISEILKDTLYRFENLLIKDKEERLNFDLIRYTQDSSQSVFASKTLLSRVGIITKYFLRWNGDTVKLKDTKRVFTENERHYIWIKGNGECQECNTKISLEEMDADHRVMWSLGGQTTLDNARCLCIKCNRSRKAA